jgi:hypothetical protein
MTGDVRASASAARALPTPLPRARPRARPSAPARQEVLTMEGLDAIDPLTGRPYRANSFLRELRRRGSFDLSYLAPVLDERFLARHMRTAARHKAVA